MPNVATSGLCGNYDNVYIYVADALRYDYVPPRFCDKYDVVKTVAGGVLSPPGFTTLITGRYPFEHGVYSFQDRLSPELETIFSAFPNLNTGFCRGGGQVGEVLGREYRIPDGISDLDEPFLVMERDLLTHAPYAKDQAATLMDKHERYWKSVRTDRSKVLADYEQAAELSFQRFEHRIGALKDEGKLEDTLVILTSDHGELLGEYGLVGHGHSNAPEVAYVPTMIYNEEVSIEQELIGHIDLFSLIAESLDRSECVPQTVRERPDYKASGQIVYLCESEQPDMKGVWGPNGGHVFVDEGILSQAKWVTSKLLISGAKSYHRRRPFSVLRHGYAGVGNGVVTYGNPSFDAESAMEVFEKASTVDSQRMKRDLSEDAKERLRELGYVEEARE